ncbi:MAG: hypothetical protein ACK5XV_05170 [Flavobacteriales bacterium]|jgi:hypothetical protein
MNEKQRTAAKQALEALEWHLDRGTWGADLEGCAAALRSALEQDAVERDALRADAERYRWLFCHDDSKTSRVNRVWRLWDGQSDWGAAIDAAMEKDESVTVPIWQTLAEIGASAPAGTWDTPVEPEPEPVALKMSDLPMSGGIDSRVEFKNRRGPVRVVVTGDEIYTVAPPPRHPLTDEEIDKAIAQERDALLDHVYEYGTTAEGVLRRVRRLARAVEAAHGIEEAK